MLLLSSPSIPKKSIIPCTACPLSALVCYLPAAATVFAYRSSGVAEGNPIPEYSPLHSRLAVADAICWEIIIPNWLRPDKRSLKSSAVRILPYS